MTGTAVVSLILAAATFLAVPAHTRLGSAPPARRDDYPSDRAATEGWIRRWRLAWALLAGAAAATLLPMPMAGLIAPVCVAVSWVVIGRSESTKARRERDLARRDLPHVVGLLCDALRAGRSPVDALSLVTSALPGAASDRLASVVPRLRMGIAPGAVWASLSADPALAPLGRALARAEWTGAPVVGVLGQLSESLAEDVRGEVEDRAHAVGVKAALPLGLCLLPSFVLLGIVPMVAGMLGTLRW